MKFPDLIANPNLKSVSWFHPRPLPEDQSEFGRDTCLKCGIKSKIIFKADGKRYLTCFKCGWIEEDEELNGVLCPDPTYIFEAPHFAYEDIKESKTFEIVFPKQAGCSGFVLNKNIVDSHNISCQRCGGGVIHGAGSFSNRNGRQQRFRCVACGKTMSPKTGIEINLAGVKLLIKSRLWVPVIEKISNLVYQGDSIREIKEIVGGSTDAICKIRKQVVKQVGGVKCHCGKWAGHSGFCGPKLTKSPNRIAYLMRAMKPIA